MKRRRWARCRAAICRRSSSPAKLAHEAPVLIAEQPTRGVDVGAIEFIHAELVRERDRGRAILLVSAEAVGNPGFGRPDIGHV